MNHRNRNSGWIWFLIIGFIAIGNISEIWLPLLIIAGVVFAIAIAAVHQSKKEDASYHRTSYRRTYTYSSHFSAADMARINVYLRHFFKENASLYVNDLELRQRTKSFQSIASLDVYQSGSLIGSINKFARSYPDSYDTLLQALLKRADEPDVFDTEAEVHQENSTEKEKTQENTAQDFIDEIDSLNQDIPDEEISKGLYETTALLKQIQQLELKMPNSKDKLQKLYAYYLPILTRILHQYVNVQAAGTSESQETTRKKLADTIHLINEAMHSIISSMTDADIMNLSADMSTLEALLRKDGLTDDDQMKTKDTDHE